MIRLCLNRFMKPPTRPLTPFAVWSKDQTTKILEMNPNYDPEQLKKALKSKWSGVDWVLKDKLNKEYNERTQNYHTEQDAYRMHLHKKMRVPLSSEKIQEIRDKE